MAVVRKYQFDVSFDPEPEPEPPVVVGEPAAPEPEPEPEPVVSLAALAEARSAALEDGRIEGEASARVIIEARLAVAVEGLNQVLAGLAADHHAIQVALDRRSAGIVLALLRKLAPALTRRTGTAEIEAMLDDAFAQAASQPRLTIRCAPDLVASLKPLAEAGAARSGFEGRLALIGDERLSGDDCRVEWDEGGVERYSLAMFATIEAAVERGIAEFDRRQGQIPPDAPAEEAVA